MPTTSTAAAVAASTTAAASSARADRKCAAYMASPDLSTVAGRQQYAACVKRLEPAGSNLPPREVVGAVLIIALVGAVIFVYLDRREGGILGPVMASIAGAVLFPLASFIVFAVVYLVAYALGLTS